MKRTNKIIMLLAVLVAGSMIAGAALVDYLSNEVTAEITVSSPMVTKISVGKESWGGDHFPDGEEKSALWKDSITIGTIEEPIRGGQTITLYTMSANLAGVEIKGFENAIVTNVAGVTSDNFVSVVVRVDSIYGDLGYGAPQELIPDGCHQIEAWSVLFGDSNKLSTWGAGETDVTQIVVTFEEAAYGIYTFSYQIVPELPVP